VVELGGADDVVEVVDVVAFVVVEVEDVVEDVVEVVDVEDVVDVEGAVVVVVGAGPSQVTAITVGLMDVDESVPLPQSTLMLPPTGRAMAWAGIVPGVRGSTESAPVTAALPARAEAAFARSVTVWTSRVSPLTTTAAPLRTTVWRPPCRDRNPNALTDREPLTVAPGDVTTGVVSLAPANPVVIIDTRAAGVTVARGEVSPEVAVRYQADSRRPAAPALS